MANKGVANEDYNYGIETLGIFGQIKKMFTLVPKVTAAIAIIMGIIFLLDGVLAIWVASLVGIPAGIAAFLVVILMIAYIVMYELEIFKLRTIDITRVGVPVILGKRRTDFIMVGLSIYVEKYFQYIEVSIAIVDLDDILIKDVLTKDKFIVELIKYTISYKVNPRHAWKFVVVGGKQSEEKDLAEGVGDLLINELPTAVVQEVGKRANLDDVLMADKKLLKKISSSYIKNVLVMSGARVNQKMDRPKGTFEAPTEIPLLGIIVTRARMTAANASKKTIEERDRAAQEMAQRRSQGIEMKTYMGFANDIIAEAALKGEKIQYLTAYNMVKDQFNAREGTQVSGFEFLRQVAPAASEAILRLINSRK